MQILVFAYPSRPFTIHRFYPHDIHTEARPMADRHILEGK